MASSTTIPPSGFNNTPFTVLDSPLNTPEMVIAIMHNYYDEDLISSNADPLLLTGSNQITLNNFATDSSGAYVVNGEDQATKYLNDDAEKSFEMVNFLNLFYSSSLYFNVSPVNSNNAAISFNSQKFQSGNSRLNPFNLYRFLLDCYFINKGINSNNIDPRILLLLRKETQKYKSLSDIKGTTIAASWDDIIADLNSSGVLSPAGDQDTPEVAVVPLSVILNYHSFVLDLDVRIKFSYKVGIEGYVLNTSSIAQPTYNNVSWDLSENTMSN